MNFDHSFQFNVSSPPNSSMKSSSSENIRERLNLHVKRRIQVQEKQSPPQQVTVMHSPPSSCSSLSPTDSHISMKQEQILPQNLSIMSTSTISPISSRTVLLARQSIEDKSLRKSMKMSKKSPESKMKFLPQLMVAENGSRPEKKLTIKWPPESPIETSAGSVLSPMLTVRTMAPHSSPEMRPSFEKNDKTTNTLDILQMVLNEKKNSMLHDPQVQKFIASIHKKFFGTRNKR